MKDGCGGGVLESIRLCTHQSAAAVDWQRGASALSPCVGGVRDSEMLGWAVKVKEGRSCFALLAPLSLTFLSDINKKPGFR